MKKFPLLLLSIPTSLMCVSCLHKISYPQLIKKLRTEYRSVVFRHHEFENTVVDEGFYGSEQGMVILFYDCQYGDSHSRVEINLPQQANVPEYFYSEYIHIEEGLFNESGRYNLDNYCTRSTPVSFYEYIGNESYQEISESQASDYTHSVLLEFNYWIVDNLRTNLRKIGLFPAITV